MDANTLDGIVTQIAERVLQDEDEQLAYLETPEFRSTVDGLRSYLQIRPRVDMTHVETLAGMDDTIASTRIEKAAEAVLTTQPLIPESSNFEKYHVDYEGVRFHLLIGQGSAYWFTRAQADK